MSWEALQAILQSNRTEKAIEDAQPPESCPYDGEPLDVHPNGIRNCKFGDYTWRGGAKLL